VVKTVLRVRLESGKLQLFISRKKHKALKQSKEEKIFAISLR
jgi:hypothetical protein